MKYKELATTKPFIVNKNLGSAVEVEPEELTKTGADNTPVVIPTQKQKYDFDRNGWVVIPNVLSTAECTEMSAFCERLRCEPESIPEPQRCTIGGALQKLADNPVIVGFLNEFLAYPPAASEDCYGFRLEESELLTDSSEFVPAQHKGSGIFRLPGDSHLYRCVPGRGWSGLTRALWELTGVDAETNNIRFISGSHKATYPIPASIEEPNSSLWESYSCPPGSLVLLTESMTNVRVRIEAEHVERVCISNLYNTVASRWTDWLPHPQLLEAMPPKRRTLFRKVYAGGNVVNGDFGNRTSAYPIEP